MMHLRMLTMQSCGMILGRVKACRLRDQVQPSCLDKRCSALFLPKARAQRLAKGGPKYYHEFQRNTQERQ
jgi:hypothetical protein